jgi:hypothetical protein
VEAEEAAAATLDEEGEEKRGEGEKVAVEEDAGDAEAEEEEAKAIPTLRGAPQESSNVTAAVKKGTNPQTAASPKRSEHSLSRRRKHPH